MKDKKSAIMAAIMLLGSFLIVGNAIGEDYNGHEGRSIFGRRLDVAPSTNEGYKKECGSCHFAYQPGLLPAKSWRKVMDTLDNHFGDNAELAPEDRKAITDYLVKGAAENSDYKASVKILHSIPANETPVAISATPYFVRKHREVPDRMVKGNQQVKSFAHCARCHKDAGSGSYNEHEVNIPGFGRFED